MPNLSEATYSRRHAEVIEFVDQSRQAMIDGVRPSGMDSSSKIDLKPEQGLIIPNLRLIIHRPDGKFIVKLIVKCIFKVNMYARLNGNEEYMGLPEEMYRAMFRETWNYARDFLKSRETPVSELQIPDMPDNAFGGEMPPISLN